MPTYEYECGKCSHRFELFQSMKDEPAKECVKCGGEVRRIIGAGAGIIFKGSGFYVNDDRKDGKSASPSGKASCAESGSCSEAGSCAGAESSHSCSGGECCGG